ncbi:glycosyltransferase [Paenibacillus koleovorans]|uniref:glycosyltransferase n=1 Tax=Paenibacillus koleovorans TaxID=121608 RepID=UPI0013E3E2CC|nr:glycosyltransferase [Paenibacillus koleovorans]
MKLALLTLGTFGDVRPFLALAYGLEERGHQVTLAGPENFLGYVTETYKRPYAPIGLNSQQVLESEEGRRWMAAGDSKQFLEAMARITHDKRFAIERDVAAACADCDLIISHPLLLFYAAILSEKLNKPLMLANPFPVTPATSAFPHFLATTKPLPFGFLNKFSYRLVNRVYEKSVRGDMNEWRSKLGGLAPLRGILYDKLERQGVPILQAFSRELVPPPNDWSSRVYITGAWKIPQRYLPEEEKAALPDDLNAWLQEGPPPIYFGFGSLPVLEPRKMVQLALEAAAHAGTRALIASGWSVLELGAEQLPNSVRLIRYASHEQLFPSCSLIVHHGGAGTTHTALESGTPSIICSTYADQPFWGERVAALGVGAHLPFSRLTQDRLLESIRKLQTSAVQQQALDVARRIRMETGLANALDVVERHLATAPVYRN